MWQPSQVFELTCWVPPARCGRFGIEQAGTSAPLSLACDVPCIHRVATRHASSTPPAR